MAKINTETVAPNPANGNCANSSSPGEHHRDQALDLHEQRRADLLLAARRLFVQRLLERGETTVEAAVADLADDGTDRRYLGAVPRAFISIGAIYRVRDVPTQRRQAHARRVSLWGVQDRHKLEKWLADNPIPTRPVPQPAGPAVQQQLFATNPKAHGWPGSAQRNPSSGRASRSATFPATLAWHS